MWFTLVWPICPAVCQRRAPPCTPTTSPSFCCRWARRNTTTSTWKMKWCEEPSSCKTASFCGRHHLRPFLLNPRPRRWVSFFFISPFLKILNVFVSYRPRNWKKSSLRLPTTLTLRWRIRSCTLEVWAPWWLWASTLPIPPSPPWPPLLVWAASLVITLSGALLRPSTLRSCPLPMPSRVLRPSAASCRWVAAMLLPIRPRLLRPAQLSFQPSTSLAVSSSPSGCSTCSRGQVKFKKTKMLSNFLILAVCLYLFTADPPGYIYLYGIPASVFLGSYGWGVHMGYPEIHQMAYLASSLCCVGALAGLSSQSTSRVGKSVCKHF